jgi:hypothetical protein
MALTATTLAGGINAHATTLQVTSATGFVVGQPIRVDNELMKIQTVDGVSIGVFRGIKGTKALAHGNLADAVTGPWVDFPVEMFPIAGSYSYGANGAITVAPGLHKIIKATSCALTLAAPTTAQEGIVLTIVSLNTVSTHTVTVTAGFGGLGASFDVASFTVIGDTLTIMAVDGKWMQLAVYGNTSIG